MPLGRGEPLVLTSSVESVAVLGLARRQGARWTRRLACASCPGHSLLSVLPPKKLLGRIRHQRVSLSLSDVCAAPAPFVMQVTLARRRRTPGATLLHPFLSLPVIQSQSVAVVSRK